MAITLFHDDLPNSFDLPGDLAIDTETMGLNFHRDRLCLVQISNGDGNAYLVQFSGHNYDAPNLKRLLQDPQRVKIFHYARFDLAMIKMYLNIMVREVFCTKIASKLVRTYTDYHGLKDLCRELLGIVISKGQQSSYWGSSSLTDEQKEYAAKDVIYLHSLREILVGRLISADRAALAQQLFGFLPTRASLDLLGWDHKDIFAHD